MILSPPSSAESATISCWFRWFQFVVLVVGLGGICSWWFRYHHLAVTLSSFGGGGEVLWARQHRTSGLGYAARYNTDKMPLKFDPFLDIHSDEIKFQVMVVRAIEVSEDSDLNLEVRKGFVMANIPYKKLRKLVYL
ncbi:hypothetical protein Tco_0432707 [Tanacetum coccineum]